MGLTSSIHFIHVIVRIQLFRIRRVVQWNTFQFFYEPYSTVSVWLFYFFIFILNIDHAEE